MCDGGAEVALSLRQLALRLLDLPHQMLNRRVGLELMDHRREDALSARGIVRVQQFTRGIGERIGLERVLHRVRSNGANGSRASLSSNPNVLNAVLICPCSLAMTLSSPPEGCGMRMARACRSRAPPRSFGVGRSHLYFGSPAMA